MNLHKFASWALLSLLGLVILGIVSAFAAANVVPLSRVTNQAFAITANALKPPECAALNLTRITVIGDRNPNNQNELIIGTANADDINGAGGQDCILGGGGDDTLRGGSGRDILLGGPGIDTFRGGGGNDICYRGGTVGDIFPNPVCENIFP